MNILLAFHLSFYSEYIPKYRFLSPILFKFLTFRKSDNSIGSDMPSSLSTVE